MTGCIVIVTRNRCDELRAAVQSAVAQTGGHEVLVIDDGSTDGTADAIGREFPHVRVVRHEHCRGLVVRRNEASQLTTADVIVSIDDDATFPSARTVAQTLEEFDDRRIGAIAIPYVEPRKGPAVMQRAPASGSWVTDSFIGTAHAVRRDLFVSLGGYRDSLIHQGEERDFCIRLLQAGYVVRLGSADPIHHHESTRRDYSRMDYYGRRNDVLFVWHYVPSADVPLHLAGTLVNAVRSAWQARRISRMAAGTMAGLANGLRRPLDRQPVSRAVYRLHRRLKTGGPVRLDAVLPELPAPSH